MCIGRKGGGSGAMRHPRDMGAREVEAFLTMLAVERKVSASTHNQALSAILFLYREVLSIKLPWLDDIGRPQQAPHPQRAHAKRSGGLVGANAG